MKLEPRKLMEQAVEVMRDSIAEPRADGKASPLVGAVLWKPDGTIETSFRGELRFGDHAEYTLLERKNRAARLDGAVLFSTLGPCAPGSRQHPKLGCAERIVLARIKEVWIGIEDPDPLVDRKGIQFLQDSGVAVRMFDRDLQEVIREVNSGFISRAIGRAAAAREEKRPGAVTLSTLEAATATAATKDFSPEALKAFRLRTEIDETVGSPSFNRRLEQLGLLKHEGGRWNPTGFGLLLFGKAPRTFLKQAGLLGTIHHPDFPVGREELKDFDGPQVFVPDQALRWLRDKLSNPIRRDEAQRREVNEGLFELVREGIVNAIVHRDYGIEGARCQLVVTPDAVAIKSPGLPVEPISLEQMRSFSAPVLSRNPVLHYVMARMGMAEERGLGLKSMKTSAKEAGLPLPRYSWEAPYLVLTLFRSSAGAVRDLSPEVLDRLSSDELEAWKYLSGEEATTSPALAKRFGFDERKAQRVLRRLEEAGLVLRVGKGRATRYELARR